MFDDVKLAPASIITSGAVLAGLGEAGSLETLPKGALFLIVSAMFTAILFFVKRDYSRINGAIDKASKNSNELRSLIETHHNIIMLQLADCLKVKDASISFNRLHVKMNSHNTRLVVLETNAGLRNKIAEDEEPTE